MPTTAIQPRRSNAVLAAFSGPCLPLAAFGVALPVTLPEYYATHVGLSIGVVGVVFMAVRLIDIAFDPLVGWAWIARARVSDAIAHGWRPRRRS